MIGKDCWPTFCPVSLDHLLLPWRCLAPCQPWPLGIPWIVVDVAKWLISWQLPVQLPLLQHKNHRNKITPQVHKNPKPPKKKKMEKIHSLFPLAASFFVLWATDELVWDFFWADTAAPLAADAAAGVSGSAWTGVFLAGGRAKGSTGEFFLFLPRGFISLGTTTSTAASSSFGDSLLFAGDCRITVASINPHWSIRSWLNELCYARNFALLLDFLTRQRSNG